MISAQSIPPRRGPYFQDPSSTVVIKTGQSLLMGQYWEFLNITLRQAGRRSGGAKWLEFFYESQPFLVFSLTVPYPSDKVDEWLEDFNACAPSFDDQGLLRFPNELLVSIVELVPNIRDKVCLALTCKRLLSISRDSIEELKEQLAAPWAGGRIICIGDYATIGGLPKGLLTQEEKRELGRERKSRTYGGTAYGGMASMRDEHTPMFLGTLGIARDKNLQTFLASFSKSDLERFWELYGLHYPAREDWVVCNLTVGGYVRAKAIAKLSGKPNDPAPFLSKCSPDLGHVILHRICWSDDASGCYYPRGGWAGHRFVITTMERMPDAPGGREWVDISERVAEDLKRIWSECPF